jgi:ribosomal protein S18 acetylase RimI-like enzyme
LNRPPELSASIDNLVATYLEVGGRVEGARIETHVGMALCRSPLSHPMANFAIWTGETGALESSTILVRPCHGFNLYVLPGPRQREAATQLRRAGWRNIGALTLLAGGRPRGRTPAELRVLTSFEERLETARFMSQSFFSKLNSATIDSIARATAAADVELLRPEFGAVHAGLMVRREGESFGIYSLCVEHGHRRRGFGSATLEAALVRSEQAGATAVLQCEPSLVRWYRNWGFTAWGEIRIFA